MTCENCNNNAAMIMVCGGFMVYCSEDGQYHMKRDSCDDDTSSVGDSD